MTPRSEPFEQHQRRYEEWFERHGFAYRSELEAVRSLLPPARDSLEVGVGTARFAEPTGIRFGVEPARAMADEAARRGVTVVRGTAERLPFADASFASVLMVTTVCFVDDLDAAFAEAKRVLRPGGALVVGFVDRESPLGRVYETHRDESVFYRIATFYSTAEITRSLARAGMDEPTFAQTVFTFPWEMKAPDPVRPGHGEGSFVVVRASKPV